MSAFRMATVRMRVTTGAATPGGPMAGRIPKVGGQQFRPMAGSAGERQRQTRKLGSKKGYTGTRAGLGRLPNGTVARSGPGGPRRFAGAVLLPKRMGGVPAAAGPRPAKQPSLFARVGQKMRRAAAAFGL